MGPTPHRLVVLAVVVVLLAPGCSSGDDSKSENPPVSETPKGTDRPAFVPAGAVAAEPVDGASVWVDEAARTVYVTDCAVARRITAEGQKYGPGPRDPQTSKFTPGYAFICP